MWCRRCGAYKIEKAKTRWILPVNAIDPLRPTEELEGTFPVVLYFANSSDADEFMQAAHAERPSLVAKRL